MLSRVPLALTLGLNTGAVDQEVQGVGSTAIWQAYVQRLLASAQGAAIRRRPVQSDERQKAFDKTSRLPKRPSEQYFHRQPCLYRGIAEMLSATTPTARRWHPLHIRIKPEESDPHRFKLSLYGDQFAVCHFVGAKRLTPHIYHDVFMR